MTKKQQLELNFPELAEGINQSDTARGIRDSLHFLPDHNCIVRQVCKRLINKKKEEINVLQ